MSPLALIEAIAYACARGAVRAWLDVLQQRSTAVEESPNAEDRDRAIRMRNAVVLEQRVLDAAPNDHDPKPERPASPG